MSDNSSSSKPTGQGIPSWQLAAANAKASDKPPTEEPTKQNPETEAKEPDEEHMTVAERAVKWLEDPSIQNASRERKVAFLLSKGVARDDIDRLLPKKSPPPPSQHTAQEEMKEIHASAGAEKAAPEPVPTTTQAPPQIQPRTEVPPVITYPEFLLQPQEKPPLVTTQRLVNTMYAAGGLAATIYGLSKYVIAPMADSLTVARHEFSQHTATQVDELNSRLEKNVSKIPVSAAPGLRKSIDEEPPSPTDSDPTELFHRDVATQTSPALSPEAGSSDDSDNEQPTDSVDRQATYIRNIGEQVGNLRSSTDDHICGPLSDVQSALSDLTQYLTDMSYNSPYYGVGYGDGRSLGSSIYTGGGLGGIGGAADGDAKDKSDAIDALKAEIRSVKGVLLSARNFPAGRSMAAGR